MLLFHKQKLIWTSQQIYRCISPSEWRRKRRENSRFNWKWRVTQSKPFGLHPGATQEMLLHLSSISQEFEWKERQGWLSFTTFPPSNTSEKSLFSCHFSQKSGLFSVDWHEWTDSFWGHGIHHILHTESPQRTDSQVRKAHKIKSGLQGHEKKKEKKKSKRAFKSL